MANNLNTVLDDAGNRALVEKYLLAKFLERAEYDTHLANSQFAKVFRIPDNSGQYCEAQRKDRLRRPEHVDQSSTESDPASGATFGTDRMTFPIEAIHEYIPIATMASWTSMIDLEEWANEDLLYSLRLRQHELAQNAFKAGRYTPGKYAADGSVSVAFDATVQTTPTLWGVTFNFLAAPAAFVNGKTAFAGLDTNDRIGWRDLEREFVKLSNAGAMKIDGAYIAHISDAQKSDLMEDDKYFKAAVEAYNGEGLRANTIAKHRGWWFHIDEQPFTENWAAPLVRATNGPIHTAILHGKNAFAYLHLGSKSKSRPTFKVQDITKTGGEKTIGYTIPYQVAIVNRAWCKTLTGPVSFYEANA
jgi:hypothetical protein